MASLKALELDMQAAAELRKVVDVAPVVAGVDTRLVLGMLGTLGLPGGITVMSGFVADEAKKLGEEVLEKRQRSIFEDRNTGSVLKKKRRSTVKAERPEPKSTNKKAPTCRNCGAVGHFARKCKVGK